VTVLVTLDSLQSLSAEEVSQRFGGKAAGLRHIPIQWRPETLLVSNTLYKKWSEDRRGFVSWATQQLQDDVDLAVRELGNKVVLRSSATNETIKNRG
jgi:hypothetical protein